MKTIFKFTFGPNDIGYIWGPPGASITKAKLLVGLNPTNVEIVSAAPLGREPDAEIAPGWRFG